MILNINGDIKNKPSWLKIKDCNKVITYDSEGEVNGTLVDILNINDSIMAARKGEKFNQYYMATVKLGKFKGLHIHPHKIDTIHCVQGKVCVVFYSELISKDSVHDVTLRDDNFFFIELGGSELKTISFPSKYPHGFFGIADNSIIINYRTPAWTFEDNFQYDLHCPKFVEKLIERYKI